MSAGVSEYVLPDGFDPAVLGDALAPRLALGREPARSLERTYYDTFDGRLRAAGLVLVHEDDRLVLRDAADAERAAAARPDRPDRLLAGDLGDGPLATALAPAIDVRALTPIARVRSRVRRLRGLNEDDKTVVRLVVEEPTVVTGNGGVPLAPRLRVVPVRGYDKPLAAVRRDLRRRLGLPPAEDLLPDAAVRATGGIPGGVSFRPAPPLARHQRADGAATVLLTGLLATIVQNVPGTLADTDTEFLHDLRVAVRRTRSAQRQLRGVFPPEPLARFRAEFRWLQQVTGPSRDLDVHLLELGALGTAELAPVGALLRERRERERRRMVQTLRSVRAQAVLADWGAFLEDLVAAPPAGRPDAERPIAEVAGGRIRAVHRRLVRDGAAIGDDSPAEALHDLRKTGKELRYLLELFAGLYPTRAVTPLVKALKGLQDALGRFQDREVQAALLRSLRDDVAPCDGGPAALMAMGLLVDRLEREQALAREAFAERFPALAGDGPRELVRTAFR